jgi:hypothetical protein
MYPPPLNYSYNTLGLPVTENYFSYNLLAVPELEHGNVQRDTTYKEAKHHRLLRVDGRGEWKTCSKDSPRWKISENSQAAARPCAAENVTPKVVDTYPSVQQGANLQGDGTYQAIPLPEARYDFTSPAALSPPFPNTQTPWEQTAALATTSIFG